MNGISKWLMVVGAIIFAIGFISQFINIGKLHGDLVIKKGNTTFYFPVVTSILLSIILSAIFYFIGRFR
ncbi:putative membrane-anchored protein [Bacillus sp. ZZV12-4809]|nr:putative membrane-anchored protein [Bacillus sp. ZZV12-4809]